MELGGYRLIGLLGEGGTGSVYLAEGPGGEQAAIKVMPPDLAANESFRRRFLRESGYARSIEHPSVIRVRDAGEADGALYMVMDYVRGIDLTALLAAQGKLEPSRTLHLLAQVALALDAVHAAGLIHRDVKPGNVIVTGEGDDELAYLTDFGVARSPARDSIALTAAGEFVGTYFYTAPEQILGLDPDHRVDVYSLACVLFECLAGDPPFHYELGSDVLTAHIEEAPPSLCALVPELKPALDVVIARALAKNPKDRFASCAELLASARAAISYDRAPTPPPASAPALSVATPASPAAPAAPTAPPAAVTPAASAAPVPAPAAGGAPSRDEGEKLRLKVTAGNAVGTKIEVSDELVIGRKAEGVGRLAKDPEISRRHARIARTPSGFTIEDLGSTNGTNLNGRRIEGSELLGVGDEIQVGGTRMVVQFSSATPPATPTPPAPLAPDPQAPPAPDPQAPAAPAPQAATPAPPPPSPQAPAPPGPQAPAPPSPQAPPPAPAPPTESSDPSPSPAPPPLALRIELDFESGEARVALDDESDEVKLAFRDGRWRLAPPD